MISKGRSNGTVRFSFIQDGARKVQVAGDFNNWDPQSLRKQKDGTFTLNLELAPGTYEYKFIIDGTWTVDPDNSAWALNPYGTLNSVAVIE